MYVTATVAGEQALNFEFKKLREGDLISVKNWDNLKEASILVVFSDKDYADETTSYLVMCEQSQELITSLDIRLDSVEDALRRLGLTSSSDDTRDVIRWDHVSNLDVILSLRRQKEIQ